MPTKSAEELAILDRLRELCAPLPEVAEAVDGFGHTSFRVANKPFVMMGSQELHLAIKCDPISQDLLVRTGEFRPADLGSPLQPDYVFDTVQELLALF